MQDGCRRRGGAAPGAVEKRVTWSLKGVAGLKGRSGVVEIGVGSGGCGGDYRFNLAVFTSAVQSFDAPPAPGKRLE